MNNCKHTYPKVSACPYRLGCIALGYSNEDCKNLCNHYEPMEVKS